MAKKPEKMVPPFLVGFILFSKVWALAPWEGKGSVNSLFSNPGGSQHHFLARQCDSPATATTCRTLSSAWTWLVEVSCSSRPLRSCLELTLCFIFWMQGKLTHPFHPCVPWSASYQCPSMGGMSSLTTVLPTPAHLACVCRTRLKL